MLHHNVFGGSTYQAMEWPSSSKVLLRSWQTSENTNYECNLITSLKLPAFSVTNNLWNRLHGAAFIHFIEVLYLHF